MTDFDWEPLEELYKAGKHREIVKTLDAESEKSVKHLWFLARAIFDAVEGDKDDDLKKSALIKAMNHLDAAETLSLAANAPCGAVHKWKAIVISELAKCEGTKARIERSFDIKNEAQKAADLDPADPTPPFLLGVWCYEVASIGWMTRKIAAAIFAEPPTASYEEALEHLLKCHALEPKFKRNIHSIVKTYLALKQTDKAKEFARLCIEIEPKSTKEREIDVEMKKLLG